MTDRQRPKRAVDSATAIIRSRVLDGQYPAGGSLPAEPALAASLGISRLTLRAAIARLEAERLVRPEHGVGVRVLDYRATAGLDVVEFLVEEQGLSESTVELIESFLELRRVLAAEAIAMACQRCSKERLERLAELAELQGREDDPDAFEKRDLEFARELVRAAESPAMELLLNTVERLYRSHPALIEAMRAQREPVARSYEAIVAAVAGGTDDGVRRAVRGLLAPIDAATIAALSPARRGRGRGSGRRRSPSRGARGRSA